MKRWLIAAALLAAALPAFAGWQSRDSNYNINVTAGGGGGYTGPGDVVSGASIWAGLRGYTAAYSTGSNPAVDLVDQANANPITINILSDGTLDVASIATWVSANSVTTIKVPRLYDQTGGGRHLVQATLATMPTLILGPVTGLASNRPAMVFASQNLLSPATLSVAQPLTLGTVAIRTSGTSDSGIIAGNNGNDADIMFRGANVAAIFAGSFAPTLAQTDNAWHSVHGAFNGASSFVNIDGTSGSTGSPGAGSMSTNRGLYLGRDGFGSALTGRILEGGVWPSALSGANISSLSSNQHSYWGY